MAESLRPDGRKRGRSLVFCEVDVLAGESDLVAKALATYRFALARGDAK
jgi:acyl-coenzyme A thioesterase PaaI-like protein